jgi:predicted RNA-binding protein YlqC (UPF0109 family)
VPDQPSPSLKNTSPDYVGLIKFLVEPFLESPNSLRIDCEKSNANERVWIRLAFEGADKGRVFGRGGRNIQAIRTVMQAIAQATGQFVHLDIYDEQAVSSQKDNRDSGKFEPKKGLPRRSSTPKPTPKNRLE